MFAFPPRNAVLARAVRLHRAAVGGDSSSSTPAIKESSLDSRGSDSDTALSGIAEQARNGYGPDVGYGPERTRPVARGGGVGVGDVGVFTKNKQ